MNYDVRPVGTQYRRGRGSAAPMHFGSFTRQRCVALSTSPTLANLSVLLAVVISAPAPRLAFPIYLFQIEFPARFAGSAVRFVRAIFLGTRWGMSANPEKGFSGYGVTLRAPRASVALRQRHSSLLQLGVTRM